MSYTETFSQNSPVLRKRPFCSTEDETRMEPPEKIAANIQWYQVVLESEDSLSNSEHDTESVYSIQDLPTECARDTSDTSCSDSDSVTDVEYEVASLSDNDEHITSFWGGVQSDSSSGTDDLLGSEVLAAICSAADKNTDDVQLWAADSDDESSQSDESGNDENENSGSSGSMVKKPRLRTCVQCKGVNSSTYYRYCEKCYQARKQILPPRPRRYRSRDKIYKKFSKEPKKTFVEPEKLRKCLSNLTQDSGIGSSQESTGIATTSSMQLPVDLNLDKIIVPEELIDKEPKCGTSKSADLENNMPNEKDMCIICTTNPKNGIFVHGSFGHLCCCYKCAVKVWTRTKRCPTCNCKDLEYKLICMDDLCWKIVKILKKKKLKRWKNRKKIK